MKYRIDYKRLLCVLLTVLFAFVFIRWGLLSCDNSQSDTAIIDVPEATAYIPLTVNFFVKAANVPTAALSTIPETMITVFNHREDKLEKLSVEEYLYGVVAAEMPASFELEALKAQAVAARTFCCYCILHRGCGSNEQADVCTNSQCCQAYASEEKLRSSWGDNYDKNSGKVYKALEQTRGLVMLYEGQPIEALFHASSGGSTENSENVFSAARPYLRAVISPNEVGSRQSGSVTLSYSDFIAKVNKAYPKAGIKLKNLIEQVAIENNYSSGRVKSLKLGKTSITGKQARKLFGLDSTMFTIMFTGDEVVFSTKGFGHGVGMSQSGANGMAKEGKDYQQILTHYYTGITISEYELPKTP